MFSTNPVALKANERVKNFYDVIDLSAVGGTPYSVALREGQYPLLDLQMGCWCRILTRHLWGRFQNQ